LKQETILRNFDAEPRLSRILERLAGRIERLVAPAGPDAVLLRTAMERHATRPLYGAVVSLELPGRKLAANGDGAVAEEALREAFRDIERQLKRYKSALRREHAWKQTTRREAVRRETKTDPTSTDAHGRALVGALILANLDRLYNFIRREIACHQAAGDLLPGEFRATDALEAVIARAVREFFERPGGLEPDRWLIQLALERLDAEAGRVRRHRPVAAPPEENVLGTLPGPRTPLECTVAATGDEIHDFYRPDEDLRLEDVAPSDAVPAPEDVRKTPDLQRYVNRTLAQMPRSWRHAFVLHHVEGLSIPETARVTGRTEPDVRHSLEYAREFLRLRVVESGLRAAP
jgi:DNA-directed RNA polymerase specialized sigma24 family protein/ribosome-associated translation inhibitor RaiA